MENLRKKSVVYLLANLLEKLFRAKIDLDEERLKLTASVPIGVAGEMNLIFWENISGWPVLVLNMPPQPWGVNQGAYTLLMEVLEWSYARVPKPINYISEFKGYKFSGWQPDSFNPMYVYLWNSAGWGELRVNRLILGGEEK